MILGSLETGPCCIFEGPEVEAAEVELEVIVGRSVGLLVDDVAAGVTGTLCDCSAGAELEGDRPTNENVASPTITIPIITTARTRDVFMVE